MPDVTLYLHDLDYFSEWSDYIRKCNARRVFKEQARHPDTLNYPERLEALKEWDNERYVKHERTMKTYWPISMIETELFSQNEPYLWICGYEVSRHYGGPEEGGWWYDMETPVQECVVKLPWETLERNTEAGIARMVAHFNNMWRPRVAYGDISSVNGGLDFYTRFEIGTEPFSHASTERPHYE